MFNDWNLVTWNLRNRWTNCIEIVKRMPFLVGHIYIKDNSCADLSASHANLITGFFLGDPIPHFVLAEFYRNRIGLPNYRGSSSLLFMDLVFISHDFVYALGFGLIDFLGFFSVILIRIRSIFSYSFDPFLFILKKLNLN